MSARRHRPGPRSPRSAVGQSGTQAGHRPSAPRRDRAARTGYSIRLTRGGFLFCLGVVVIGFAAVDSDSNLLLLIFGLCLSGILVSAFRGWRGLRKLSARRVLPDVMSVGRVGTLRYEVAQPPGWSRVHSLLIREETRGAGRISPAEAFVPYVGPGEMEIVDCPIRAETRGRIEFTGLLLATRFPFAIFEKRLRLPLAQEAVVFPRLGRVRENVRTTVAGIEAAPGMGGPARARGDEEYYGVREFRPGDNPKRIHWRRTARTGQLMLREMSRTRERHLWCAVDGYVPSRDASSLQRLEQAISAAATLLCDALESGIRVGLLCSGDPIVILPPGTGRALRPRLLSELALIDPIIDDSLSRELNRFVWPPRWRGPCVLFTAQGGAEAQSAEEMLGRLLGPVMTLIPGEARFEELIELVSYDSPGADARGDRSVARR